MAGSRLEEFERFDIAQEPWCRYRLEDGTILKAKFVLTKVGKVYSGTNPSGAQITGQTILAPEVPKKLHGPRGTPLPVAEVQKYIDKASMPFRVLEERPCIYILGVGRILNVQLSLANVARTSLFDQEGQPQYLVTHNQLMMVSGVPPSAAATPGAVAPVALPGAAPALPSPVSAAKPRRLARRQDPK